MQMHISRFKKCCYSINKGVKAMTEYQFFGVLFFGFILLLILFAFVLDFSEKCKNQRREQELHQWQHKRNKKHIEKGFEL